MTDNAKLALPAFAARLKMLRRVANIKQSVMSDELGISQSSLSRWESGVQSPHPERQLKIMEWLAARSVDDAALKRLIKTSTENVHLVEETSHRCLAYSPLREQEWRKEASALIGQSLWRYATMEIQAAEAALADGDWWEVRMPAARSFSTSGKGYPELVIHAGNIRWERLYLADGTPVRLCTSYA